MLTNEIKASSHTKADTFLTLGFLSFLSLLISPSLLDRRLRTEGQFKDIPTRTRTCSDVLLSWCTSSFLFFCSFLSSPASVGRWLICTQLGELCREARLSLNPLAADFAPLALFQSFVLRSPLLRSPSCQFARLFSSLFFFASSSFLFFFLTRVLLFTTSAMKAQLFSTLACLCFVFFLPRVSVSLTTTEVELLHVFEEDDNVTTPATTTSVSALSSLSPVTTTSTSSSTTLPIQEEEDISISISISSSNISTTVGEDGKLDPQPALSTASPGSTSSLQPLKLAIEVTTKSGSVPESSHFSSTVSSQSHSQKSAYGHPSAGLDDILASSTYDASSATTVSSEHSVKSQSVTERQPSGKSQDKEDKKQKEEDKERREEATQANKRPFPLTSQSDELTTSKQVSIDHCFCRHSLPLTLLCTKVRV